MRATHQDFVNLKKGLLELLGSLKADRASQVTKLKREVELCSLSSPTPTVMEQQKLLKLMVLVSEFWHTEQLPVFGQQKSSSRIVIKNSGLKALLANREVKSFLTQYDPLSAQATEENLAPLKTVLDRVAIEVTSAKIDEARTYLFSFDLDEKDPTIWLDFQNSVKSDVLSFIRTVGGEQPGLKKLLDMINKITDDSLKTPEGKKDLLEWALILEDQISYYNNTKSEQVSKFISKWEVPSRLAVRVRSEWTVRIEEKKKEVFGPSKLISISAPAAEMGTNYVNLRNNLLEGAKAYLKVKRSGILKSHAQVAAGILRAENLIAKLELIGIQETIDKINSKREGDPELPSLTQKLNGEEQEISLLACCIVCPPDAGLLVPESTDLKNAILHANVGWDEYRFNSLKTTLNIGEQDFRDETNALNTSKQLADDTIDNLKSRLTKLIETVKNYKNELHESQTDEGHIRAKHLLMALEEIKALDTATFNGLSQIELQRKLYGLVYLLTFTTSAELNARVLAAFGWVETDLQNAVDSEANVSLFGDIKLSHLGAERLTEARKAANLAFGEDNELIQNEGVAQVYKEPRSMGTGGYTDQLNAGYQSEDATSRSLIGKLENALKGYTAHDDLSHARVKNISDELKAIKSLPQEPEKKRRLLTLMCAVVFKSGSSGLAGRIETEFNSSSAISVGPNLPQTIVNLDGRAQLKRLQLANEISDYAALKQSQEVNALGRVPDWRAFKEQILGALDAYRRSDVGGLAGDIIARAAQKELEALNPQPDGKFSHVDQHKMLSIIARLQKIHGVIHPALIESIVVSISKSGINAKGLEALKNDYKASTEGAMSSPADEHDRLFYDLKRRMNHAEIVLMGNRNPEIQALEVELIRELQKIETLLLSNPNSVVVLRDGFDRQVGIYNNKVLPFRSANRAAVDRGTEDVALLEDDALFEDNMERELSTRTTVAGKTLGAAAGTGSASVPADASEALQAQQHAAAASVPTIAPETINAMRSQLFVNLRAGLLNAAENYLMTDWGLLGMGRLAHEGGELRAKNFKAALAAIPDPMTEKDYSHLILLAASVITGAGSKTLAGYPTTFCTKVLASIGITTEAMDRLWGVFRIPEEIRNLVSNKLMEKEEFTYFSAPKNWSTMVNALRTNSANQAFAQNQSCTQLMNKIREITSPSADINNDPQAQNKLATLICGAATLGSPTTNDFLQTALGATDRKGLGNEIDRLRIFYLISEEERLRAKDGLNLPESAAPRGPGLFGGAAHASANAPSAATSISCPTADGDWIKFKNSLMKAVEVANNRLPPGTAVDDIKRRLLGNLLIKLYEMKDDATLPSNRDAQILLLKLAKGALDSRISVTPVAQDDKLKASIGEAKITDFVMGNFVTRVLGQEIKGENASTLASILSRPRAALIDRDETNQHELTPLAAGVEQELRRPVDVEAALKSDGAAEAANDGQASGRLSPKT